MTIPLDELAWIIVSGSPLLEITIPTCEIPEPLLKKMRSPF
jgi:hypothetical protein